MQIAIFSDVHGNLTALEAVLADIKQQKPDLIVFAGDLCLFGARPRECIEVLQDENIASLYGNTDEMVGGFAQLSKQDIRGGNGRGNGRFHDDILTWTQHELGSQRCAWLRTLPFHRRISVSINPRDDLLIVHANPNNVHEGIQPDEEMQQELYGEVKQADDRLKSFFPTMTHGVIAFGHVHVPCVRRWSNLTLVNISSVSLAEDKDNRAKYCLLSWRNGQGWQAKHHHLDYNIDHELDLLKQKQLPNWQQWHTALLAA